MMTVSVEYPESEQDALQRCYDWLDAVKVRRGIERARVIYQGGVPADSLTMRSVWHEGKPVAFGVTTRVPTAPGRIVLILVEVPPV